MDTTTSGIKDQGKNQATDFQARALPILKRLITQIRKQQGWIQNYKEDLSKEVLKTMDEGEALIDESRAIRPSVQIPSKESE